MFDKNIPRALVAVAEFLKIFLFLFVGKRMWKGVVVIKPGSKEQEVAQRSEKTF